MARAAGYHLASPDSSWLVQWGRIAPLIAHAIQTSQFWLGSGWRHLFGCRHWNTPLDEGKCYCPDCGLGIIVQWVLLRCEQCHNRRELTFKLGQWRPSQHYCPQCGYNAYKSEVLENPKYHQLQHACLLLTKESGYCRPTVLAEMAPSPAKLSYGLLPSATCA